MKKSLSVLALIALALAPLAVQEDTPTEASSTAADGSEAILMTELVPVEGRSPGDAVGESAVDGSAASATDAEEAPIADAETVPAADAGEAVTAKTPEEWQFELDKALSDFEYASFQLDKLQEEMDSLTAELAISKAALAQSDSKNAALSARIEELERALEALKSERSGLVAAKAVDSWDFDRSVFSVLAASGFAGSTPATGKWDISGGKAVQKDPKEFFAKLRLPLDQGKKRTLYTFTAKAGSTGWAGLGLHFFISGKTVRFSYGEGRSLLVWFTRDPANYPDKATYLQLYRSDGLVNMEQVFDGKTNGDIAKPFKAEILYDPVKEYVLVAVDGSVRVVYKTFFGIGQGVGVALRTLGPGCEFSNFSVRTEP